MTFEFLLTSLIVILLPGTGVIYTVAIGLSRGFHPAVAAALGCTFGIVPAAVASILGLAAIFHTSALAFVAVKYLGVAYLIYMAWNILRDDGVMQLHTAVDHTPYWRIAFDGMLLNVLNPKLSLFFLAFLPQFVPAVNSGSVYLIAYLACIFMLMTFFVFVAYGAFAAATRTYVIESPAIMAWLRRGFAGAFAVLGLKLAMSDR